MKAYQLMTLLEKAPAGAEITICLPNTKYTEINSLEVDGDEVKIFGEDAMVTDQNGEDIDWLSNLAETAEEESE